MREGVVARRTILAETHLRIKVFEAQDESCTWRTKIYVKFFTVNQLIIEEG